MPRTHEDILRPPRNQGTQREEATNSISQGQGTPAGVEDPSSHTQTNRDRGGTLCERIEGEASVCRGFWQYGMDGANGRVEWGCRDGRKWGPDRVSQEGPAVHPAKDKCFQSLGFFFQTKQLAKTWILEKSRCSWCRTGEESLELAVLPGP